MRLPARMSRKRMPDAARTPALSQPPVPSTEAMSATRPTPRLRREAAAAVYATATPGRSTSTRLRSVARPSVATANTPASATRGGPEPVPAVPGQRDHEVQDRRAHGDPRALGAGERAQRQHEHRHRGADERGRQGPLFEVRRPTADHGRHGPHDGMSSGKRNEQPRVGGRQAVRTGEADEQEGRRQGASDVEDRPVHPQVGDGRDRRQHDHEGRTEVGVAAHPWTDEEGRRDRAAHSCSSRFCCAVSARSRSCCASRRRSCSSGGVCVIVRLLVVLQVGLLPVPGSGYDCGTAAGLSSPPTSTATHMLGP